jgi:hypothetical protein
VGKSPLRKGHAPPPWGDETQIPALVQDSSLVGLSRAEVVGFCVAPKISGLNNRARNIDTTHPAHNPSYLAYGFMRRVGRMVGLAKDGQHSLAAAVTTALGSPFY